MVTVVEAQQAAVLAQEVTQLEGVIAQLEAIITANDSTVASILVKFNESPAALYLPTGLTKADTNALLSAGLAILQGYLATAQAALGAI